MTKYENMMKIFSEQDIPLIEKKLKDDFGITICNEAKDFLAFRFDHDTYSIWTNINELGMLFGYDDLFEIDNEDIVPVIQIGEYWGEYIYLMLESGEVFVIHHDNLSTVDEIDISKIARRYFLDTAKTFSTVITEIYNDSKETDKRLNQYILPY